MKINILGNPLASQTIECSNKAQGISPYVYTYTEELLYFMGTAPIKAGDVIQGKASLQTAIAVSNADEESGTGWVQIKSRSGSFLPNEVLTVGSMPITMVGVPQGSKNSYLMQGQEAVKALITVFPKFSLRERAFALVAFDGSTPDHNSMLGHAIKDGDEVILNTIDEIKRVRFLEFTAGSKVVVSITCFFA